MKTILACCAVAMLIGVAPRPMLAHHGAAAYDMSKSITLKGTVTKITWANPHISFFVDVTDTQGKVMNWGFDAAPPSALQARGWKATTIKAGDIITIEGFPARDGKPYSAATRVTVADGRTFIAGSDGAYPK